MSLLVYCECCELAMSRLQHNLAIFEHCPDCGNPLKNFYSFGSDIHRERWEEYKNREKNGMKFKRKPLVFPYREDDNES